MESSSFLDLEAVTGTPTGAPRRFCISPLPFIRTLLVLLTTAVLTIMGASSAWAQTATSSTATGNNTAAKALEPGSGSRWESVQGDAADPSWWKVDYGDVVYFNTINILWEGAYAKSFKILATNNATVGNAATVDPNQWEELKIVTDQTIANPNKYKQVIDLNGVKSYRYVCFYGIKRATQYGYSFYEFKPTLSSTTGTVNVDIDLNTVPSIPPYNLVALVYPGKDYPGNVTVSRRTNATTGQWRESIAITNTTRPEGGFQVVPLGQDYNNRYIRFSFSNSSDPDGFPATIIKGGEATATIKSASTQVNLGKTMQLTPEVALLGDKMDFPTSAFQITNSNDAVGTVNPTTGVFTPKAKGTTTLTYVMKDYNGDVHTNPSPVATITLQVYDAVSVSATKTANNRTPQQGFDGDETNTRWASGALSASQTPVSYTIDYGYAHEFDIVGVVWHTDVAKSVTVYGSNNGTDWTKLASNRWEGAPGGDKTRQGIPMGEMVAYRYVKLEMTPNNANNGCSFYEIFTDVINDYYLNATSNTIISNVKSPTTDTAHILVGGLSQVKAYAEVEERGILDVTAANATVYSFSPAGNKFESSRNFRGETAGTVTITGTLHRYGDVGIASGHVKYPVTPAREASVKIEVHDYGFVDRTFVHTPGIAEPNNQAWPAWRNGVDNVDTSYLTSADDSRIEDVNGIRQKTHVTEHMIYALPGETLYLEPYTDFHGTANYQENFIRWYDYRTDVAHPWLIDNSDSPSVIKAPFGVIAGTQMGVDNRSHGTVARLTIPAGADFKDKPIIIAMDAAQDAEFRVITEEDGKFKEPLINFRHLFIIYDARAHVADYSNSVADNLAFTQARKRYITARAGVNFQVRLNYKLPTANNYGSGMLYEDNTDNGGVYGNESNPSVMKTHGQVLRVGKCYVKTFDAKGDEVPNMFTLGNSVTTYECTADNKNFNRTLLCTGGNAKEGTYTVRIYATDLSGNPVYVRGTTDVPLIVQEYEIKFVGADKASFYTEAEQAAHASEIEHEQYIYLDEHYEKIATVNYDQYPLNDPDRVNTTGKSAKIYKWPVPWEDSNYSFGYGNRHDYNMYVLGTHSSVMPYHAGADTWPKENNFPGSANYDASRNSGGGLYDRRYYETKGEEMGYFYYINAASDPGVMARVRIDDLCLGSTLFVTGWVAEFSQTEEKANLIFNFNAVLKDGRTITLHSYTTGYVPNNEACGKWYKAYYSFVPQTQGLHLDDALIDHYELALENNCISSNGADYAIDDIRVWVSKPDIRIQQMTPLCNGETEAKVKVSAKFESLLATMGLTPAADESDDKEYMFFYTLIDKKKYDEAFAAEPDPYKQAQAALEAGIIAYQYEDFGDGEPSADPKYKLDPMNQKYGMLKFHTYFEKNLWPYQIDYISKDQVMREVEGGVPYIVFNTKPTILDVRPGNSYMVALWAPGNAVGEAADYTNTEEDVLKAENFLIDDKCAKVTTFRVLSAGVIKVNGEIVSSQDHITICENQYPVIQIDVQGLVPVDPANWPDNSEQKLTVVEENAPYDWYFGTVQEYYAAKKEVGGTTLFTLDEAVHYYREYYNGENPGDDDIEQAVPHTTPDPNHIDSSNQPILLTQEMIDYLKELSTTPVPELDNHPILLLYKRACPVTPTLINGKKEYKVTAVPIKRSTYWVDYDGTPVLLGADKVMICTDPTEVMLNINSKAPLLKHGFGHDQEYPATLEDVPLRIGYDQVKLVSQPLEELQKVVKHQRTEADMIAKEQVLTVPVRSVSSTSADVHQLKRTGDVIVYLYETNDPEYMQLQPSTTTIEPYPTVKADDNIMLPQVGLLLELDAPIDATSIANDLTYFRLVFRDDFRFKEGFYYRLRISYMEQYPDGYTGTRTECDGQMVMTLKIVPKYQEWVGGASTDYNNDLNWRRISSTELYHKYEGADYAADNDPKRFKLTDGFSSSTNAADAGYARYSSYVPMDFTDVIIPKTIAFPRMYKEEAMKNVTYKVDGTSYTWAWPQGENDGTNALHATATKDIQYDMAAFNYDKGVSCRPWYANTCEHITFLHGGEMYQQQYLNYQRAWVELEIEKDRWYTLTSPLQSTVSGDMYLPTDGDQPARQVTEHFQPITYDPDHNDRFRPAVYQRAWDHSGEAKVYELRNGGTAGQGSTINNAAVRATWTHVYNDGLENFTDGKGFSILTDLTRMPGGEPANPKVLFRLPKDDASYFYHNSELPGTNSEGEPDPAAKKDSNYSGTIRGDYHDVPRGTDVNGVPRQARLNEVSGTIASTTETAGQYFLVGNPFMCHMDMKAFFDANPQLNRKFWIFNASHQETSVMADATEVGAANVYVAPLQGFFVETKDAATSVRLDYKPEMMAETPVTIINIDGGQQPGDVPTNGPIYDQPSLQMPAQRSASVPAGQLRLRLIGDNSEALSTAVIASSPYATAGYDEERDAVLLLDSDLDEQPSIYTVAGATAVSVNSIDDVKVVPVGIVCPDDFAAKKMLTLAFEGADLFPQSLYLYDAVSGETTPIQDGMQISVPARSMGQYFITNGIDNVSEEEADDNGAVYNLKGIRVASTKNERVVIQGGRKVVK